MDIEKAKEEIERLIQQGKYFKVEYVLNFLIHCLPVGEVEELARFAIEKRDLHAVSSGQKKE